MSGLPDHDGSQRANLAGHAPLAWLREDVRILDDALMRSFDESAARHSACSALRGVLALLDECDAKTAKGRKPDVLFDRHSIIADALRRALTDGEGEEARDGE